MKEKDQIAVFVCGHRRKGPPALHNRKREMTKQTKLCRNEHSVDRWLIEMRECLINYLNASKNLGIVFKDTDQFLDSQYYLSTSILIEDKINKNPPAELHYKEYSSKPRIMLQFKHISLEASGSPFSSMAIDKGRSRNIRKFLARNLSKFFRFGKQNTVEHVLKS